MNSGEHVATEAAAGASRAGASQGGGGRAPRPGRLGRRPRFRAAVATTLVRSWCGAAAVFAGDAAAPAAAGGATGDARPNILFIFSDDHAPQAIGAYGSRINRTPHIDRLAREGALFANSFCANSVCGPSRACILTGKHSHANGFLRNGDRFDGSQTTFPKLLQQAGYQTALIGKWHLESTPAGFDHWEVLPDQGAYYNPDFLQQDGSRQRRPGYCTDLVTDLALTWLKTGRDANKPFLLMCQHKAPHRNWSPAPRHFGLYRDADIPPPPTLHDDYAGRSVLLRENEMTLRDHLHWGHDMKFHGPALFPEHFADVLKNDEYDRMTAEQRAVWDAHYEPENQEFIRRMRGDELSPEQILAWKYQRYVKDYLRCVAAVDDSVGRLLAHLDECGLADDTIVVYASDQGFYLGEHGWYDKRWMFEESLRMPLLVRWPGRVAPGSRPTALVQNIDYAPTFLEAAGLAPPADIHGRSLLPLLRDEGPTSADWRRDIYYAYYENAAVHNVPVHDGVRGERYKLIHFPRTQEWNLFDLQHDPHELVSRHDDPQYADVLRALQQRRRDLRDLYGVNSAAIPATRGDEPEWQARAQLLQRRVSAAAPPARLAFVGDSITQGWETVGRELWDARYAPRDAVNLGVSGDRTEHVLWRLTRQGGFEHVQPEFVVLLIGTNNTGRLRQNPGEVAAGVQRILDVIARQAPSSQVLLHGVFPRGASPLDPLRLNNRAINERLRRMADGQRVHWLDLDGVFLDPDGSLPAAVMPDALHPSAEGYRRWADALDAELERLGCAAPSNDRARRPTGPVD